MSVVGMTWGILCWFSQDDVEVSEEAEMIVVQTDYYRAALSKTQPAFVELGVDSLGKKERLKTALGKPAKDEEKYVQSREGLRWEYRREGVAPTEAPCWSFEFGKREIVLRSALSGGEEAPPLKWTFDQRIVHVTLLGLMPKRGRVQLPALLHLPDHGTFRITEPAEKPATVRYSAWSRRYVRVGFDGATKEAPLVEYRLEPVLIHPEVQGLAEDARFDGFRRNWLNILQLNPEHQMLSNNASSDPCGFCLYEYAEIARKTPPLAEGLRALDLVGQTLDRYLAGKKGYGMVGFGDYKFDAMDTYPSLLIAAHAYVEGIPDDAWLKKNYAGLQAWAEKLLAYDKDEDGLLEFPVSGNAGSWNFKKDQTRPSNWWDAIGFGHQDAYSNALAYRALVGMAEISRRAQATDDEKRYRDRAEKLKSKFVTTFLNPKTGVLAGWRSADGKLHDYYFTFVNGVAISYGLVPDEQAHKILDALLAKMKEVKFTRFDLGIPGNLIPIRREDYVHLDVRWGGPEKEDGTDAFQIYENGGATACFAYFTLNALYKLGRKGEADAMFLPMLQAFEKGEFQGMGANGMSNDWRKWDGTPYGYEGFLVDNYLTFLAVLSRAASK